MKKIGNKVLMILMAVCMITAIGQAAPVLAQSETAVAQLENQLTVEALQELNNGSAVIYTHDDKVTFISGTCSDQLVTSIEEAGEVAASLIELLGGNERVQLEPWRTLNDPAGNIYYVLRQMYAGTTVLDGAVKVITDADGNMIALSSSIETDLPDVETYEGITAEEAEQIVVKQAEDANEPALTVLSDFTDKIILPVVLNIDADTETSDAEARFVWVVYTNNNANPLSRSSELPYLAHYVDMEGNYLYCLATIIPGDSVGSTGFDTDYIFEFMEPVDYTGYVDLSDGTEMELTVTVMRDTRTGMYYLGNIERKMVVADCWEFLYNNENLRVLYSPDNLEWDQVALLSLYNYCRAYDFYKEIGWIGPNGLDTPILILNDYCDENHTPVDNAAFVGNYLGWMLFVASQDNDFSQSLDVIAHEFTHGVTGSVMTYNSYLNDYGAINEAMSDIMGKIADLMNNDIPEERRWLVGSNSVNPVRSISNPHAMAQPEFSWDLYYQPNVSVPTPLNDNGGVHTNSSLLNLVAYDLIEKGGMSLEEARTFWFAVDCTMVPGTDYAQLSELLPWVLKAVGMDQYETELRHAIDSTRLGIETMPDFFDDDRALVTLTLPETEAFADGNWAMQIYTLNINLLISKATDIFSMFQSGDFSDLPETLGDLMSSSSEEPIIEEEPDEEESGSLLGAFLDALLGADDEEDDQTVEEEPEPTAEPEVDVTDEEDGAESEILDWLKSELAEVYYSGIGSAGQDGKTIQMVVRPGRTVPFLMHMTFNESGTETDQVVFAVYIMDNWYNFTAMTEQLGAVFSGEDNEEDSAEANEDTTSISEAVGDFFSPLIEQAVSKLGDVHSIDDILDIFSVNIKGGEVTVLGNEGLETIVLPEPSESTLQMASNDNEPHGESRMSRPKQSDQE